VAKKTVHRIKKMHKSVFKGEMLNQSRFSAANLAVFALIFAGIGTYAIFHSSAATDLYVSSSGSSSGSCTQSTPCSVSRADSLASAGTTIHLASGNYSSASLSSSGSNDSSRIVWTSTTKYGAHFPTLNVGGHYVDIVGMDVGNVNTVILLTMDGNYDRAIGNYVHDNLRTTCDGSGGAGIEAEGWQNGSYRGVGEEIVGNIIARIGRSGCGRIQGAYTASLDTYIANNVIYGIDNYGVHAWHNSTRTTVVNNTIVDSGSCMVIGNGDNDDPGPYVNDGSIVRNNICVGNGFNNVSLENATNVTQSNNLFSDPGFVNRAGGDLHLLSSASAAINKGTSTNAPSTDFDGNTRPQGGAFDIGAFEFVSSQTPPPTPPPPNPTPPPPTPPPPSSDTTPPTAPSNLHQDLTNTTQSTIWFAWTSSTDNVGLDHYEEYRDGTLVDSDASPGLTSDWVGGTLSCNTSHTVGIEAVDAAGNHSSRSTITATTAACTSTPPPTPPPPTPTPPPPPPPTCKAADINCDGIVNIFDLSILLSHYNGGHSSSDLNNDNVVNIFDLSILLSHYGH
jgi:hypothetical protein